MTETPVVPRLSGGLIAGLVVATPFLLGVGLLEAKWATADVWWAEATFFGIWMLFGILGLWAKDLVRMTRAGIAVTGLATASLPLIHLLLFGSAQSLRGTAASVNLSLIVLGAVLLVAATRVRRQPRNSASTGDRLDSLPSGGPTRGHAAAASAGAVFISALLSACATLLVSGTPLERIVVGVLLAPVTGLPTLFWGLFAGDTNGCIRRLSLLGVSSLGLLILTSLVT